MAVEFMDGFDHLAAADLTQKWDNTSSVTGASKVTGVFSLGSAQRYLNANRTIQRTLSSAATKWVAFHFRLESLPASDVALVIFRESTTTHTDIRVTAAGAIRATRAGTSLGISSTGLITTNTWYWLAVQVTIDNSAGVVSVSLNNSSILSLTSQDTQNGGTAAITNIQINSVSSGNNDWDNLAMGDTTGSAPTNAMPTEEWRINTQLPSGAGSSAQFTPSASTNQSNVDDATSDGDSTYNSSTTAGHVDLFAIANFDAGVVRAVQTNIAARRDDAGPREIREKCRSDGANYNGSTQAITGSYVVYREIRHVDPDTSAAWASAALDAAEFGYELVT